MSYVEFNNEKPLTILGTSFNPTFFDGVKEKFQVKYELIKEPNDFFKNIDSNNLDVIINDKVPRILFYKYLDEVNENYEYDKSVENWTRRFYKWRDGDNLIMYKLKEKIKNIDNVRNIDRLILFYKMKIFVEDK